MRKNFIISAVLLAAMLTGVSRADTLQLQDNAPDRYVVVKGDTLWDISGRFLKTPWRWPEIWRMNKEEIKNPHWIYPGDVIVLDRNAEGGPRLRMARDLTDSRYGPRVRVTPLDRVAVPALPMSVVGPYLTRPLVINENELESSPRIVAGPDDRVVMTTGDRIYAAGLDRAGAKPRTAWHVYRPGKALVDPDLPKGQNVLGYEATYLGDVEVLKVEEVSTLKVGRVAQEIMAGDRLVPAVDDGGHSFVPHGPKQQVRGRVIGSWQEVNESGQFYVVSLNRGARDGLERGHVLQVYQAGRPIAGEKNLQTPAEQYADLLVFRVFDKVAYGLIAQSSRPVHLGDEVREP